MSDSQEPKKPSNDIKQSFAWGQLFAGSLIGGLAVWKLLHKMTNTEPSEWSAGLSAAYEEVRDFLMTPFSWIQLDLTADEKNAAIVTITLVAALTRALFQSARSLTESLASVLAAFLLGLIASPYLLDFTPMSPDEVETLLRQMRPWLGIAFASSIVFSVVGPVVLISLARLSTALIAIFRPRVAAFEPARPTTLDVNLLTLANVVFTGLWGTALLLLNWATS